MAGGGFVAGNDARKIKGGRWTVFRFFLVSVAFTSAWMAVSSQLAYYRRLHGPAVLLQLNIAYFLPSIPLLIVSALLDKPLEARLGVARTILVRLLVGLLGYGAICIWFPFMPEKIWFLLSAVVALGLFSGIAFSASYQLVARFANKNVIALGLGCSASGPLVLLMQLALHMGTTPTKQQQVILYETISLVIVGGLWATVSLLLRHWESIESHAEQKQEGLDQPLLDHKQQQQQLGELPSPPRASITPGFTSPLPVRASVAMEVGAYGRSPNLPMRSPLADPSQLLSNVWKQTSMPPLLAYNSLEPFQTFLSTDQEALPAPSTSWGEGALLSSAVLGVTVPEGGLRDSGSGGGSSQLERQLSAPPAPLLDAVEEEETAAAAAAVWAETYGPGSGRLGGEAGAGKHAGSSAAAGQEARAGGQPGMGPQAQAQVQAGGSRLEPGAHLAGERQGAVQPPSNSGRFWQTLGLIWAPLAALILSGTIALTLFPFFTYVPTSGLLGETLPKVLFFVRIFADVLGRFLPRLQPLSAQSPITPLLAALVKLAGVPIFFVYLKTPDRLHSDVAAVVFVGVVWVLGGYINTMSNMLAPRLAPPELKTTAAGMMAIAYQLAHFLGLAVATVTCWAMFGHIGIA